LYHSELKGVATAFLVHLVKKRKKNQRWVYRDGNKNRKQLVPAVVSFAKQRTEAETTYGPGRPARPLEAKMTPQIFFWDIEVHQRACLLKFGIKFSRVSSTQKTCFSDAQVLKM